jgi:hypothetical protein
MRTYCGAVISIEKRSSVQPRPIVPNASSAALVSPHFVNSARAHSPAARSCVDPVSRGPWTSVSQLSVSMTAEC